MSAACITWFCSCIKDFNYWHTYWQYFVHSTGELRDATNTAGYLASKIILLRLDINWSTGWHTAFSFAIFTDKDLPLPLITFYKTHPIVASNAPHTETSPSPDSFLKRPRPSASIKMSPSKQVGKAQGTLFWLVFAAHHSENGKNKY